MGRAYYDVYRFDRLDDYQPPSVDSYASVDDAGPISVGRRLPVIRSATRCEFDKDGDLVYGGEVSLFESMGTFPLPLPQSGCRNMMALVFETSDPSLKGHTVTYTEFPYHTNNRGYGRLKPERRDAIDKSIWEKIDAHIQEKRPIDPILDSVDYDLWRTSGKSLRGYIFEPLRGEAEVFSGRRASSKQFKQAEEFSRDGTLLRHLPDALPPALAAIDGHREIILYGIVEDYQAAMSWLQTHELTSKLRELSDDGKLFNGQGKLKRKFLPQAARDQAPAVLTASAHNVLCGTFDPEEYRGFVQGRRDPDKSHKQTLAIHLKYLFIDAMYNLSRRFLDEDRPRELAHADQSQYAATAEGLDPFEGLGGNEDLEPESFSERVESLKFGISNYLPKQKAIGALVEVLRSGDEEQLVAVLVLTVALHELGQTDEETIAAIHELNENASNFDKAVQSALQQAVTRLAQR